MNECIFLLNQIRSWFGVKVDDAAYCTLAHGAELRHIIGAHAAILHRAIYAFAKISATFKQANTSSNVSAIGALRRWARCVRRNHVIPLLNEVMVSSKVCLPCLYIWEITRILIALWVLVAQPTEAVPKLVNDDRLETITTSV